MRLFLYRCCSFKYWHLWIFCSGHNTPRVIYSSVIFLWKPLQFMNLNEIVRRTVNIAQSHKHSFTDSRILFFLSKLYYQINLGYVNRSSVKIGNISSSFCFCACIDLHMLYFISKRGFTHVRFFSVSQGVANCFYFTMPLPYTKEISQYTYNQ